MKAWPIGILLISLSSWMIGCSEFYHGDELVDEWIERPEGFALEGVPWVLYPFSAKKGPVTYLNMAVKPRWAMLRISGTGTEEHMRLFNIGLEPLVYAVKETDSNRWIWAKQLGPTQGHLIRTSAALVYLLPIPVVKIDDSSSELGQKQSTK
ncbi:hypothetical protein PGT21_004630 [Puccinia graminis f. sp. tritici]|uniref:Uncharacterized protein n=2 Tax=Puccinia graminis f. sp. tritici TaxID=56615 RepID=A0A5B0RQQ0_PUCGR|nr:hypothetical protein PGT21_004630 [Puccinia graminis f. sp. tritici]KAA1127672.1 hypothetical protein PGTUg99_001653 [Puccinia graminis f. sp. tritici]